MPPPRPSLTEWVVLALLAEAPSHGFALARQLASGTDLGRVLTVRRPLVYRALDRMVAANLAEAHHAEPGDAGPTRTLHRLTSTGRREVDTWLNRPVDHVRDLRIEFLLKLRLIQRSGGDPRPLISAQRSALADTLRHLSHRTDDDVVDRWRHHNAMAVDSFLSELSLDHSRERDASTRSQRQDQ